MEERELSEKRVVKLIIEATHLIGKQYLIFFEADKLYTSTRKKDYAMLRFIAMSLIKEKTNTSDAQIGKLFDRDRTTVMHGIQVVNTELKYGFGFICKYHPLIVKKYKELLRDYEYIIPRITAPCKDVITEPRGTFLSNRNPWLKRLEHNKQLLDW